jgi:hypothetical protein
VEGFMKTSFVVVVYKKSYKIGCMEEGDKGFWESWKGVKMFFGEEILTG